MYADDDNIASVYVCVCECADTDWFLLCRGWAWTRAILGLQVEELHLCGEPRSLPVCISIFVCACACVCVHVSMWNASMCIHPVRKRICMNIYMEHYCVHQLQQKRICCV